MNKNILFIALIIASLTLSAQEDSQRLRVGVRLGPNISTMMVPSSTIANRANYGYNSEQKFNLGATAGLSLDIQLTPRFSLQTGLYYGLQRFKQGQTAVFSLDTSNYSIASENGYLMHRLKVPVMLYYHFSDRPKHWMIGAGLYVDGALSGDLVYDASIVETTPTHKHSYIASGNFDPYKNDRKKLYYHLENDDMYNNYTLHDGPLLRRFDVGVSAEVGYQVNKFYVGAHVDFGLLNQANRDFLDKTYHQRLFNLQLLFGYKIN